MENICDECGAELKEGAKFCQECGSSIEQEIVEENNFCPNCGEELIDNENFCEHCGYNLNNPDMPSQDNKSFIEKHKVPLIFALIAIIVIIAGLSIFSSMNSYDSNVELPPQTVTVGAEYFEIPGGFTGIPSSIDVTTEGGVVSFSESWSDGYDRIDIGIITSGYSADLESVAASGGGVRKNLMGYDGYYNENDISSYTFSFVLDNKICIIGVSSPHLYDEIKVM